MRIAPSRMLPSENRRVICDVTFREAHIGVPCRSDRVSDSLTKDVPMEYSARSLRQSRVRYARHTSALLSVALILCGILPVGAGLLWPLEESQPPRAVDAIVILSGGLDDQDSLNVQTAYRLLYGLQLFKQGYATTIVLSGGNRELAGVAEAEVMANVALGLGVPASAVLVESGSDRTRTQGLAVARIARDRRIHSILLVTSPAHAS